jgi:hypothetical protein
MIRTTGYALCFPAAVVYWHDGPHVLGYMLCILAGGCLGWHAAHEAVLRLIKRRRDRM